MAEADATRAAALREALLGQLRYLVEELEMLRQLVGRVPEAVLTARPLPEDASIKALFGQMARADEDVHLPRLRRIVAEDRPVFEPLPPPPADERWDDDAMGDLLAQVQDARRTLVAFLEALPGEAWRRQGLFAGEEQDVFAYAHRITQDDVEQLRAVSLRLHESQFALRAPG